MLSLLQVVSTEKVVETFISNCLELFVFIFILFKHLLLYLVLFIYMYTNQSNTFYYIVKPSVIALCLQTPRCKQFLNQICCTCFVFHPCLFFNAYISDVSFICETECKNNIMILKSRKNWMFRPLKNIPTIGIY